MLDSTRPIQVIRKRLDATETGGDILRTMHNDFKTPLLIIMMLFVFILQLVLVLTIKNNFYIVTVLYVWLLTN